MDLFFFDKAEKVSSPIPRCNLLQIFAKYFRFIEFFFLLLLLSWSFTRLPVAIRISAEYVGKLLGFIATPLFGFILCNAIIVALVAKPTKFSSQSAETDRIYEDLIEKSESGDLTERDSSIPEEIVYEDKQIIVEAAAVVEPIDREIEVKKKKTDLELESGLNEPKVMLRTLSEKLTRECVRRIQSEKLRRSETEKCRNLEHSSDILYSKDDLSSEEFQRKIEAFIAREKKFRREESSAIVLHCDG